LGADAEVIRKHYEKDCGHMKPLLKSPELITEDNFNEHLGDDRSVFIANPDFCRAHGHLLQVF